MSTRRIILARYGSGSGDIDEVRADSSSMALQVIDYSHHEIHGGSSYVASQRTAVNAFDIAAPMTFKIVTANTAKRLHLTAEGEANAPAFWELFKDDGNASHFDVTGGSSVTPTNRDHESTNVSGATITSGVTVTQATSDVLIETKAIAKASSGGDRQEHILERNTSYLLRATSYTDNNEGSFSLNWYEHTHKHP
ncbi:MAG: hypothetical protein GY820_39300 [Gammaproteobacteria bacterium]|nr:hypothetical protein [Gammaproteobacteria bacterium]